MSRPSNQTREHAERLVAIQLLGYPRGRRRESVHRALEGIGREAIDEAITNLENVGVLVAAERTLRASDALTHLDRLKLIGV